MANRDNYNNQELYDIMKDYVDKKCNKLDERLDNVAMEVVKLKDNFIETRGIIDLHSHHITEEIAQRIDQELKNPINAKSWQSVFALIIYALKYQISDVITIKNVAKRGTNLCVGLYTLKFFSSFKLEEPSKDRSKYGGLDIIIKLNLNKFGGDDKIGRFGIAPSLSNKAKHFNKNQIFNKIQIESSKDMNNKYYLRTFGNVKDIWRHSNMTQYDTNNNRNCLIFIVTKNIQIKELRLEQRKIKQIGKKTSMKIKNYKIEPQQPQHTEYHHHRRFGEGNRRYSGHHGYRGYHSGYTGFLDDASVGQVRRHRY